MLASLGQGFSSSLKVSKFELEVQHYVKTRLGKAIDF